ncbi:speckle-type POZ protein [Nephila pilipes]|uniref:Speckle-type POZ protein n=1 Tax=Nephila pilipes TaxID=299642 RepID=A0A8X6Q8X9_NEPPI|nr:speckle-type POZ protein [Nephila pilipes]
MNVYDENGMIPDFFTYIWAIENCPMFLTSDGIKSPIFEVNSLEKTKWNLAIKETTGEHFPYFIQRVDDSGPESIEIFLELSFLSAEGFCLNSKRHRRHFKVDDFLECAASTDYVFRLHKVQYVVNDTLTLRCRMRTVKIDIPQRNLCFARTRLGLERRTLFWDLRNFSTLQFGHEIKYLIESLIEGVPPLNLALFVDEVSGVEYVIVKFFKSNSTKFLRFNCVVSILDVNGNKRLSSHFEDLSNSSERSLKLFEKTKIMEGKAYLLPNDSLSLRCEFKIGSGVIWSEIEFYVYSP